MSEPMKKPLIDIVIDGKSYQVLKDQKKAILTLIKGIAIESNNPFKEIENELPKYAIVLRGARKRLNLSQKNLSKKTGIDISNISKMENGERPIGVITAKKIAKVLNVNYKIFLER